MEAIRMSKSYQNKETLLFVQDSNFRTGKRLGRSQWSLSFRVWNCVRNASGYRRTVRMGAVMRSGRSQCPSWKRSKVYSFLLRSRFWPFPAASLRGVPFEQHPLWIPTQVKDKAQFCPRGIGRALGRPDNSSISVVPSASPSLCF